MFYKLQHITHAETHQLCNPTILCCQNRQPRCATTDILSKYAITQNYHINKVAPRASSLTSKATSANNTSSNLGRCPGVFSACHNTENDEEEKQKTYYPTYCPKKKKNHFHRFPSRKKKQLFHLGLHKRTATRAIMLNVRESWKLINQIQTCLEGTNAKSS